MSLFNLSDLCAGLRPGECLIGLDPGKRRIGVALSDVGLRVAGPYGTLLRGKLARNADEVLTIARREAAGGLVIGLPLSMDGRFGPAAQAVRDWARALSEATGLPAALFDERLSSETAHERLSERGVTPAKRAALVDRLAAAEILQDALDKARERCPLDPRQG